MNILNIALVILILSTGVRAEKKPSQEIKNAYEEDMLTSMCRSTDHRFNSYTHTCAYCAQSFRYDPSLSRCIGTRNLRGKCYGKDHYRARTQECVYCACGYVFNENADIRTCEPLREDSTKKKEKETE